MALFSECWKTDRAFGERATHQDHDRVDSIFCGHLSSLVRVFLSSYESGFTGPLDSFNGAAVNNLQDLRTKATLLLNEEMPTHCCTRRYVLAFRTLRLLDSLLSLVAGVRARIFLT